jgi:hypothetical protein
LPRCPDRRCPTPRPSRASSNRTAQDSSI